MSRVSPSASRRAAFGANDNSSIEQSNIWQDSDEDCSTQWYELGPFTSTRVAHDKHFMREDSVYFSASEGLLTPKNDHDQRHPSDEEYDCRDDSGLGLGLITGYAHHTLPTTNFELFPTTSGASSEAPFHESTDVCDLEAQQRRRLSRSSGPFSTSQPDVAGGDGDVSPANKNRNKLGYHRSAVACGHCRRRKIRCIPPVDPLSTRCQNCIRLKKDCQFFPVEHNTMLQPKSKHAELEGKTLTTESRGETPTRELKASLLETRFTDRDLSKGNLSPRAQQSTLFSPLKNELSTSWDHYRLGLDTIESALPRWSDVAAGKGERDQYRLSTERRLLRHERPASRTPFSQEDAHDIGSMLLAQSPALSRLSDSQHSDCLSLSGDDSVRARVVYTSAHALINLFVAGVKTNRYMTSATNADPNTSQPSGKVYRSRATPKRKLKAVYEDDGDEEKSSLNKRKPNEEPPNDSKLSMDARLLACPFHKYDTHLYGSGSPEPAYRTCGSCTFVNVAYLKQHLQRNHSAPKVYCYSCCRTDFGSQAALMEHQRVRPACDPRSPPLFQDRIHEDLAESLRIGRKNDAGMDRVSYWYEVFDALFPGIRARRHVSPYFEGCNEELLNRFVAFCGAVAPRVIESSSVENRSMIDHEDTTSQPLVNLVEHVLQQALGLFADHLAELRWPQLNKPVEAADHSTTAVGPSHSMNIESFPVDPTPPLTTNSRPTLTTENSVSSLTLSGPSLADRFLSVDYDENEAEQHRVGDCSMQEPYQGDILTQADCVTAKAHHDLDGFEDFCTTILSVDLDELFDIEASDLAVSASVELARHQMNGNHNPNEQRVFDTLTQSQS